MTGAANIWVRDTTPRFDSKWLLIGIPVALVVWLALVPLVFLLAQSFLTPQSVDAPARFTLDNFRTAYFSTDTARLFLNSVQFAAGSALFALVVGTALAWMNERTNTPFKSLFFALAIIPLVIPGILFTVSWIMLASPKIGHHQSRAAKLFDTDAVFVNIYSMAGMIWVDGLHYSPMAFLLMTAAFRSMDPSLEESALMSGASRAADRAPHHLEARLAGGARLALDPVRARDRIVRGAGAARPAGRHPGLYLVDLPGDPPISEPDRARLRLCGDAAADHLARHLFAVAALEPGRALLHRDRQGLSAAHHRPRPLALSHGGDLHPLFRRHRAAAVPGAGVVVAAEILQRAVLGALAREPRFLPRRAGHPAIWPHGVEQPYARGRQRDGGHAGVGGDFLDRGAHQDAGALAARQPGLAAAGVPRAGARARDHDLLSLPRYRRLRHALDHADRLCHALPALRHALQSRPRCCRSTRSSRNPPP